MHSVDDLTGTAQRGDSQASLSMLNRNEVAFLMVPVAMENKLADRRSRFGEYKTLTRGSTCSKEEKSEMMATRIRAKGDTNLNNNPLHTMYISHSAGNGIRPRMRRRIPSIPATANAAIPSRKKPGSAGSTRSSCSTKSTSSVRSATSAKSTSSTSAKSGPVNSDLDELHDYDEGQDVKFINVPSSRERNGPVRITPRQWKIISPEEVLSRAQETDCSRVYQIDLHAAHIDKINNLDQFTKVRVLDLSCNHISTIQNLHHCKELRELKLYDNIIQEIQNLEELKDLCHLQLQHNKIRELGKGLSSMKNLRILRIDSNSILKLELRELASCSYLTSVDISNNKIDNLAALSCLPNLEELQAVNNRLRTVADLSRCKKLQEVDLSYNRLTDLSGLKGLANLKTLHVAHNHLSTMKSLGKVKGLEELNLCGNRISDLSAILAYYPALQILDASQNHVHDWLQVCGLSGLRELVELYIADNPFCQEDGPKLVYNADLQKQVPTLEILDGAHIRRPTCRPTTPMMRPMSAATVLDYQKLLDQLRDIMEMNSSCNFDGVVSARQVENQLHTMEHDVADFESIVAARFESLRAQMGTLPVEAPSRPSSCSSSALSTPGSSRPGSKSSKRSRLKDAMAFAEGHF